MSETVTDPKIEGRGSSWGFSVAGNGDLVARNWYLFLRAAKYLCGVLIIEVTLLIYGLISIKSDPNFLPNLSTTSNLVLIYFCGFVVLFVVLGGPIAIWKIYHESKGIEVTKETITYPVRPGAFGIFPFFRKTVQMNHVVDASTLRLHEAPYQYFYVIYLSGEFGVARLLFDTKGGRDRLLAILKSRFSEIDKYRWT